MKKILIIALVALAGFSASAYNPPVYGEDLFELSSPRQLTNGSSVAGGPLFYASTDSITTNPALTAYEQRVTLNAAYTAAVSSNTANAKRYGNAFQAGILIPFKWAVFTGYLNGTMIPLNELYLGNSINIKAGLSKEVTEKLSVGLNLNTGLLFGDNGDWGLSANLGFLYKYGNLGFLKDFRYAASISNLGKNYTSPALPGINAAETSTQFPFISTIKVGAAGSLVSTEIFKLGASLDLTTPLFQNLIADLALEASIKDMLFVTVSEKINIAELMSGHVNVIPSVGLFFKFSFDVKNNAYLEKNGWSESEMTLNTAYKTLYDTAHLVSLGVDVNLGMKDNKPPVIQLWDGSEDGEEGSVFDIELEIPEDSVDFVGDAK